ncbi:unnamed protein product [Calicophoron daubneyi]|uniref:Protein-tyrosine-phosphatase n=1 Tax=Calicophoron daubneyi TaxID=300641 RepID=A0AAV2SY44_CALDB
MVSRYTRICRGSPMVLCVLRIVLLVLVWCHVLVGGQQEADRWSDVKRVASVRPRIRCAFSNVGKQKGLTIEWMPEKHVKHDYTVVPIGWTGESLRLDKNGFKLLGDRGIFEGKTFSIRAIRKTSQGDATLTIQLPISWKVLNFKESPPYELFLDPQLTADGKRIAYHRLYWAHSGLLSTGKDLVIAYNSTHTLQQDVDGGELKFPGLSPGSRYEFCVISTDSICHDTSWKCITQTIPILRDDIQKRANGPKSVRNLRSIGRGSSWIQLAWSAPSRSLRESGAQMPQSYLISAFLAKTPSCPFRIYYIQSPWIELSDKEKMNYFLDRVKTEVQVDCSRSVHPKLIYPLDVWPDWGKFDEQLDEFGPLGEFVVTLDELGHGEQYTFEIVPVYSDADGTHTKITVSTTNPEEDCGLNVRDDVLGQISWNLPNFIIKESGYPNEHPRNQNVEKFQVRVTVERIGHPGQDGNQTCFVDGCDPNTQSTPELLTQGHGLPQRIRCFDSDITIDRTNKAQVLNLPCLRPCLMYHVTISTMEENPRGVYLQCTKGLVWPGKTPKDTHSLSVSAPFRNVALLDITLKPSKGQGFCPVIGFIVTTSSEDAAKVNQLFFTLEDLETAHVPPFVEGSHLTRTGDVFRLMINNPSSSSSGFRVEVRSFVTNAEPGSLESAFCTPQSTQCHLDCLWPMHTPFSPQILSTGSVYLSDPYSGMHASTTVWSRSENRYVSTPCKTITLSAGVQSSRCRVLANFLYAEHGFCSSGRSFDTCAIPRCDRMAMIPCVSDVSVSGVNETSVTVQWRRPIAQDVGYQPAGFLILLTQAPSYKLASPTCVQAIIISDERKQTWRRIRPPSLVSLITGCPTDDRSTRIQYPVEVEFGSLVQNTTYEVVITALDDQQRLGGTWKEAVRTKAGAPCTIQQIKIAKAESHALVVSWTQPTGPACGLPTQATVFHREEENGRWSSFTTHFYANNAPEVRVAQLLACKSYCVYVLLVNEVGSSNASVEICGRTKRQAFTHSPTVRCELLNGDPRYSDLNGVSCRLIIGLEYTETCPVSYIVEYNVLNGGETKQVILEKKEGLLTGLGLGLIYRFRVYAQSPEYGERSYAATSTSYHQSHWSPWSELFTGMSSFRLTNFSVFVQPSKVYPNHEGHPLHLCVMTSLVNSHSSAPKEIVLSAGDNDLCFQVRWGVDGRISGLIGFAVQLFGTPQPDNRTENSLENEASMTDETDEREHCLGLILIKCDDCLGKYSLKHANNHVVNKLKELISQCSLQDQRRSRSHELEQIDLRYISTWGTVHASSESSKLSMNVTPVEFLLSMPQILRKFSLFKTSAHRQGYRFARLAESMPTPLSGKTRIGHGRIQVHTVSTNEIVSIAEQGWQVKALETAAFSTAGVVGIVAGIILVLILLLVLAALLTFNAKRRDRMRHSALQKPDFNEMVEEDGTFRLEMKQPIIPPKLAKLLLHQPDPISVHEFVSWLECHSHDNCASIREEFQWLKRHSMRQEQAKHFTHHVGLRPENRLRNKYRNLVPFDHNYVRLAKPWCMADANEVTASESAADKASESSQKTSDAADGEQASVADDVISDISESSPDLGSDQWIASDYMNASLIPGRAPGIAYCLVGSDRLPRTYIAAQAPVKHTRALFWQMIWDHGVRLIVMLTRLKESGKEKCAAYWPNTPVDGSGDSVEKNPVKKKHSRTLNLGHFSIRLLDEMTSHTYTKRRLQVKDLKSKDGEQRVITQLQMLQWPDFSAPTRNNFSALLYTYWTERRCCANTDAPVLVHCSAGIGRTGTFIVLDQLCQQVRFFLQPDFEPIIMPTEEAVSEEPVYVNLNEDPEESPNRARGEKNGSNSGRSSVSLSSTFDVDSMGAEVTGRQNLLTGRNSDTRQAGSTKKKRFRRGKHKTHDAIDVYRTVLWLRSNRSFMVQSEDQYLFIYQYLSHFIQQINNSEQIYENI